MGRKRGKTSKDPNLTSIVTSIRRGLSSKDNDKSSPTTNKKKKDDQTFIDIGQPSLNHQNMETSNASDDALDESPDVLVTAPPSPRAPSADSIIHLPSLMQQISTNLPPVHHDLQRTTTQPISTTVITNESTSFALSRFPFPPFTIRFNSNNISPSILHCRLARSNSIQQRDYLLYVKNATSFCFLLETNNWPNTIKSFTFSLPLIPRIPPQLSLIIKDVDLNIDFDEFCSDIKSQYPDIKNVVRLKNKFDKHIKLIKIELTSLNTREKLLNVKRILVNYIYYSIDEYLAPFQVLICSKCAHCGSNTSQPRLVVLLSKPIVLNLRKKNSANK